MLKLILPILLCAPLLTSCASSENTNKQPRGASAFASDPRLGEAVNKICFNRSIDGFSDNRRDTVVLRKGVSEDYLVEVYGGCINLRNAKSIGIVSRMNCIGRGDDLIVSESVFSHNDQPGMGPQRCSVKAIYKWDKSASGVEQLVSKPQDE